jgi:hypothetical protein
MESKTETWHSVRDGEYFCNDCDQQLVKHTVTEAFVLGAPSVGTAYTCPGKCGRSVIIPGPSMFSS